jgi:hypothetical protein
VRGIRRTTAVVLAAVALGGCAGLTGGSTAGLDGSAGAGQGDAGRRLVHRYEFPDMGIRLDPPTGRPRLTWQQAARSRALRGFFRTGRAPEVKLADYRNTLQGPAQPVLVWVAIDPASVVVDHGPDFRPARTGPPDRCPLYLAVDAGTGRGYGAWQTCDPPYLG